MASKAMAPELKDNIRAFVADGGGYVGFCAGGFLATEMISDRGVEGLGILPGRNELYDIDEDVIQMVVLWRGAPRDLYWEGGPFFKLGPEDNAEVTATYPNGAALSVRALYGNGRVYVTGAHPEATPDWREENDLIDTDGMDYDLAIEMIDWASGLVE